MAVNTLTGRTNLASSARALYSMEDDYCPNSLISSSGSESSFGPGREEIEEVMRATRGKCAGLTFEEVSVTHGALDDPTPVDSDDATRGALEDVASVDSDGDIMILQEDPGSMFHSADSPGSPEGAEPTAAAAAAAMDGESGLEVAAVAPLSVRA